MLLWWTFFVHILYEFELTESPTLTTNVLLGVCPLDGVTIPLNVLIVLLDVCDDADHFPVDVAFPSTNHQVSYIVFHLLLHCLFRQPNSSVSFCQATFEVFFVSPNHPPVFL